MKLTTCKRCDAKNVFWFQAPTGKWILKDESGNQHHCDDGKLKAIKCKYCNSNDLHWAEELVDARTQQKKMVLTESYGLPHACDERIAFLAKEKQDKKNKYEAEKMRIAAAPDGKCVPCNGSGYKNQVYGGGICSACLGQAEFTERSRKHILASVRRQIWPNMQEYVPRRYGRSW